MGVRMGHVSEEELPGNESCQSINDMAALGMPSD